MILFWEYSRVSGSIADDSIGNDLFCECSSEGWRSPIALTFEPITKIWRAHILQSKPFNISLEKYVRYLIFFRFDKIFLPMKTVDKKERKGNISPQWKWCPVDIVHPTLDSPRKKSGRITCGAALTLLWWKSNCFHIKCRRWGTFEMISLLTIYPQSASLSQSSLVRPPWDKG